MTLPTQKLLRRARLYLLLDWVIGLVRLPAGLVVWLMKVLYLVLCMISWAFILWVLGEKHVGVLKVLILLASVSFWVLVVMSVYSIWVL